MIGYALQTETSIIFKTHKRKNWIQEKSYLFLQGDDFQEMQRDFSNFLVQKWIVEMANKQALVNLSSLLSEQVYWLTEGYFV